MRVFAARLLPAVLLLTAAVAGPADSAEKSRHLLPFREGERLVFDVSWLGMIGGEGILRVRDTIMSKGVPAYIIEVIGRSTGVVGDLYPIEDHTYSYFDIAARRTQKVEIKIREGSYRKHKVIDFDQKNHKATYKVDEDPPEVFDIEPDCQDAFSVLYAFRALPRDRMKIGESVYFPLFDDKKKYSLEIKVLRKERIELPMGMVDTIVVEPLLKSEGVFRRKGKMNIWFTDDKHLTPVMMRSKIFIGSIYATLREYENVDIKIIPFEDKKEPQGKK